MVICNKGDKYNKTNESLFLFPIQVFSCALYYFIFIMPPQVRKLSSHRSLFDLTLHSRLLIFIDYLIHIYFTNQHKRSPHVQGIHGHLAFKVYMVTLCSRYTQSLYIEQLVMLKNVTALLYLTLNSRLLVSDLEFKVTHLHWLPHSHVFHQSA